MYIYSSMKRKTLQSKSSCRTQTHLNLTTTTSILNLDDVYICPKNYLSSMIFWFEGIDWKKILALYIYTFNILLDSLKDSLTRDINLSQKEASC